MVLAELNAVELSTLVLDLLRQLFVKLACEEDGHSVLTGDFFEGGCCFDIRAQVSSIDLKIRTNCSFNCPTQVKSKTQLNCEIWDAFEQLLLL